MFEYASVELRDFTDPVTGDPVTLRLLHRTDHGTPLRTIDVQGRDLDLLARQEMGSYEEMLKLVEANDQVISENLYDLEYVDEMVVPV